ncbi:glutaminase [Cylindrospermopsis raciborskii]|uniref:glutaminase n=1 Tax=Cylindrospermopsis raciborskii TaxID=77022 RepID=UPI0038CFE5A7
MINNKLFQEVLLILNFSFNSYLHSLYNFGVLLLFSPLKHINKHINFDNLSVDDLSLWMAQSQTSISQGQVLQRIPLLANINPLLFAVYIYSKPNIHYSLGDYTTPFPFMSVIKPFSFLYLLEHVGEDQVLQSVGTSPSSMAFNSLEQLISDKGYPRNPMINSGAITVAHKLNNISQVINSNNYTGVFLSQPFVEWLNKLADTQLYLDVAMLNSVRSTRSPLNLAIARILYENGYIDNIESALDIYEEICCISGTVVDVGKLGKLLARESGLIAPEHRLLVNHVMLGCGLYESSPYYAQKIGLPMKSGISGALLAIIPDHGAIAIYSPALDLTGNSIAGLRFIETLFSKL